MGIQDIIGIVLLVCCGVGVVGSSQVFADEHSIDLTRVVTGNNAFGMTLYQHMAEGTGNLFICPYSIRTALLMTFAGAQKETAAQMARVLSIQEPVSDIHQAAHAWQEALKAGSDERQGYRLQIANALWGQQGYAFQAAFVEQLNSAYGGGLHEVDFTHALEEARQTINAWVEQKTGGQISEFLKPQSLDPSVMLVLTNSVYFKGAWTFPFDPQKTMPGPFFIHADQSVDVPMMSQTLTTAYGEDDAQQVIELPYGGERLSMVVIVPKQLDGLRRIEQQLSAQTVNQALERLRPQKIMVTLPRWSMETEVSLPDILRELGMTDAFALPAADFSGMTGGKDLYISAVLHKAVLDVTEEGAEAAAATEVSMSRGLRRTPEIFADRPFLVMILDRQTGGILFIGRVMDPRG